jgi:primosomal replication protein N
MGWISPRQRHKRQERQLLCCRFAILAVYAVIGARLYKGLEILHVNVCTIVGRVSKRGPKLSYATSGTPACEVILEVDEVRKGGQVFTPYIPVEIFGKYAETAATELEAGDEVQVSGKLKYKSSVDPNLSKPCAGANGGVVARR